MYSICSLNSQNTKGYALCYSPLVNGAFAICPKLSGKIKIWPQTVEGQSPGILSVPLCQPEILSSLGWNRQNKGNDPKLKEAFLAPSGLLANVLCHMLRLNSTIYKPPWSINTRSYLSSCFYWYPKRDKVTHNGSCKSKGMRRKFYMLQSLQLFFILFFFLSKELSSSLKGIPFSQY